MVKTMRKHPILVAIIGLIIGVASIVYIPIDKGSPLPMALLRIVLVAIMIGIMILMGAKKSLLNVKEGFSDTLRKNRYLLILALILGMFIFIPGILNYGFSTELLQKELSYFILCITVGLFEESLFRGVVFQGFLRKAGNTRKGIWIAIIISSIIFGAVHVYTYVVGESHDLTGIIESIGKTLQTGAIGVLLAAVYLKTKNLWATALVHTLNDFFLMQAIMFSSNTLGNYVTGGTDGVRTIIIYVVQVLLYVPALVKATKIIKEIEVPEYGVFEEK